MNRQLTQTLCELWLWIDSDTARIRKAKQSIIKQLNDKEIAGQRSLTWGTIVTITFMIAARFRLLFFNHTEFE